MFQLYLGSLSFGWEQKLGRDLKGKELGVGIDQRKDGKYRARVTNVYGKRICRTFSKLRDAKNWISDESIRTVEELSQDITLNELYDIWMELKRNSTKASTYNSYEMTYQRHVKPILGRFKLTEIKTYHCQKLILDMAKNNYANNTLLMVRAVLKNLLQLAVDYDYIEVNPFKPSVKCNLGKPVEYKEPLSVFEQKIFTRACRDDEFGLVYLFLLQTGMRIGELSALTWDDINMEGGYVTISKTAYYDRKDKSWRITKPKSRTSERNIPLTDEAKRILLQQKKKKTRNFVFTDEKPLQPSSYDFRLKDICEKTGLRYFSVHLLRHTFATRCIEAGALPKTVQSYLGHSSLSMTMDRYVHATPEQQIQEMKKIQSRISL